MSADNPGAANVADEVLAAARARFASFDAERFARFVVCGNGMQETASSLPGDTIGLQPSYLRLCAEAVGLNLLGTTTTPSLLDLLFTEVVPNQLITAKSAEGALHLMARAWNIGENVGRAARWIDPYLAATFRTLALDINELGEAIAQALEKVTTVETPPLWQTFSTSTLDLSTTRASFLPGTLHAVAPGLLCVHDRHVEDASIVVAVDHGGRSRVVGSAACLGDELDATGLPDVDAGDGVALVGKVMVQVPTLRRSFWSACVPRGFVAITAVDSQRLWLLESLPGPR